MLVELSGDFRTQCLKGTLIEGFEEFFWGLKDKS